MLVVVKDFDSACASVMVSIVTTKHKLKSITVLLQYPTVQVWEIYLDMLSRKATLSFLASKLQGPLEGQLLISNEILGWIGLG